MATKTIAWGTGSGNITLTYTGQGNGSVSVKSDANDLYEERVKSITIKTSKGSPTVTKTVTIKQKAKSLGWTTKNFEYTGGVQSIELPKGKYKLQCWGAQGGTSYGNSSGVGSKGGYSEGVLTLTETTTLYVFVGGKGSRGSSTSLVNGGWNGGGASVGYSSYDSSGESGYSYPACGGGATDICTVTSSMSYSSGRTNRSSESLLSRIIVAGGGGGGSYRHTKITTTTTTETLTPIYENVRLDLIYHTSQPLANDGIYIYGGILLAVSRDYVISAKAGEVYRVTYSLHNTSRSLWYCGWYNGGNGLADGTTITVSSDMEINPGLFVKHSSPNDPDDGYALLSVHKVTTESTTDTSITENYSNQSQQGGGTSGKGQFPGTQTSAGSGGGFGYGGNQTTTNYRYCSGGGGGGWYGGGRGYSDRSPTSYVSYTGGGSGFVNIAANSSYRPSGYTGLQLDSGTTIAGNTSHPSTSGGTETGHSGNGYARITAIDGSGSSGGGSTTASISWAVQTGNWTEGSNSSAKDGKQFTSVSPGSNGSTRLRCTFSGVTSITFNCVYNGESNYDYLTVGALDSTCTRDSYGTTLKGTSGTAKDIIFSCDSGTHYVEFCYSKDGSVDTSPDCAVVYVKSYS